MDSTLHRGGRTLREVSCVPLRSVATDEGLTVHLSDLKLWAASQFPPRFLLSSLSVFVAEDCRWTTMDRKRKAIDKDIRLSSVSLKELLNRIGQRYMNGNVQ